MDVETTQIAAAWLGIGTVILCRRQKKRREWKIWVKPWIRRGKQTVHFIVYLKRQFACAQRPSFLASFGAFSFFGDFFEVVLQATSAMFVTNYPRGYTKVGFCYSQTEKSPVNRLKIRACSKSRRFCGDKSPRNRHEIAASLHGRFGIATNIAAKIAA